MSAMADQLEPYRQMWATFETDDRIGSIDDELHLVDRHLINSNDRYQMTAAFLLLASNRFTLTQNIYDNMQSTQSEDVQGSQYSPVVVTDFLRRGYQTSKDSLEAADFVFGQIGYSVTASDQDQLQTMRSGLDWPDMSQVSLRFVNGCIRGVGEINADVRARYDAIRASVFMPNMFRRGLQRQIEPLFAEVTAKVRAIERVTGGLSLTPRSATLARELYEDARSALETLDEIALFVTMPKLRDSSYELARPLDELKPDERSFSPDVIARPVVQSHVQVVRPSGPQRPFSADVLQRPEGEAIQQRPTPPPVQPQRPFNPDTLQARGGNAEAIPVPPAGPQRSFSRDILDSPKGDQPAPGAAEKPFDASTLKKRVERPFDPSTVRKVSSPEEE